MAQQVFTAAVAKGSSSKWKPIFRRWIISDVVFSLHSSQQFPPFFFWLIPYRLQHFSQRFSNSIFMLVHFKRHNNYICLRDQSKMRRGDLKFSSSTLFQNYSKCRIFHQFFSTNFFVLLNVTCSCEFDYSSNTYRQSHFTKVVLWDLFL